MTYEEAFNSLKEFLITKVPEKMQSFSMEEALPYIEGEIKRLESELKKDPNGK